MSKEYMYYKDSARYAIQENHRGGDGSEIHIWGTRSASASGILEKVREYVLEHPVSFGVDADSFLELFYYAFTEYNVVESPEFKEETDPLKEKLRGLTDKESDEYMDIVFGLCIAYERQGYMEGVKVGFRLMMYF